MVADLERADAAIVAATGRSSRPLWSPSAGYRDARVRRLAATRGALSPAAFEAAWAEGHRMSLDEAVAFAVAATQPARVAEAAVAEPGGLTPREREVAGLAAKGLSNRQIAEALVIAEGTARAHVEHILGKLGLRSRAQLAAWAVRNGLAEGETP